MRAPRSRLALRCVLGVLVVLGVASACSSAPPTETGTGTDTGTGGTGGSTTRPPGTVAPANPSGSTPPGVGGPANPTGSMPPEASALLPTDPDTTLVQCDLATGPRTGPTPAFPFGAIARAEPLPEGDPLTTAYRQMPVRGGPNPTTSSDAPTPIVLSRTPAIAVIGNANPPGQVTVLVSDWTGQDVPASALSWSVVYTTTCPAHLPVVLPGGMHGIGFSLDRQRPAPEPTDTEVDLWLTDDGCPGDPPLSGRLHPVEVAVDAEQVRLGITADIAPSGGGCTSTVAIPVPFTVELPEPIGDRVLVDGLVLPPAPVR